MLKLYDHYEPYVAGAMIMSCCAYMDVSCLEIRALTKQLPPKSDAKLWPYYVRNLSGTSINHLMAVMPQLMYNQGISVFYSFACFPKNDHADLIDYIQAIPEMLIFTNFLNDVLRYESRL